MNNIDIQRIMAALREVDADTYGTGVIAPFDADRAVEALRLPPATQSAGFRAIGLATDCDDANRGPCYVRLADVEDELRKL